MRQKTLIQYFEWYIPEDGGHWKRLAADAGHLKEAGFTDVWFPPAYKGAQGIQDVGYGVYDLYDLGEFDQKGTVPTKYGTREEYLAAIREVRAQGMGVMVDIVLNHKMGADGCEEVMAGTRNPGDRNQETGPEKEIKAWTSFTFPGRGGAYSGFCWNHTHFDGVDWDDNQNQSQGQNQIYQLDGKHWDTQVDAEKGNYDYLMGADLDMNNPEVVEELDRWGAWYLDVTEADGFRLDAVKHIRFTFFSHWLEELRRRSGRELWAIGEYWSGNLEVLREYREKSGDVMSLFDVPLHFNFVQASQGGGNYDMRGLFEHTLMSECPEKALTFVDNHDTQPGQSLQSWVQGWFKPLAYACILLRQEGVPCVFYGDYYGIPHDHIDPVGTQLDLLLEFRQKYAWGRQQDYLDHENVIGWVRAGDSVHPGSGCAVILSDNTGGQKVMDMGEGFAGAVFVDGLGNCGDRVVIGADGKGCFPVSGGSVSVWIPGGPV